MQKSIRRQSRPDGHRHDRGDFQPAVQDRCVDRSAGKFRTVDALVSLPRHDPATEPPCLRKTLGLIGFHVMHKTKSRLPWIWTSFEHVDNVPEEQEVKSRKLKPSYSFYNPRCNTTTCPVN